MTNAFSERVSRRELLRRLGRGAMAVTLVSLVGGRKTPTTHASDLNTSLRALAAPSSRAAASPVPFAHGQPLQLPFWSDMANWTWPQYYSTLYSVVQGDRGFELPRCVRPRCVIQCADIDGDGADELIGRGPNGVLVNKFDPTTGQWLKLPDTGLFADAGGWDQPQYYSTIQLADIDGDSSGTRPHCADQRRLGLSATHGGSAPGGRRPRGPGLQSEQRGLRVRQGAAARLSPVGHPHGDARGGLDSRGVAHP
jgi:hypothetical protein